MTIIGIDLGSSNSIGAVYKDGKIQLIPDASGEVLVPSIVSVSEQNELIVGKAARFRQISHPSLSASNFKRLMGSDTKIRLGKGQYSAAELSAMVLRQIKSNAENFLHEPITKAVISVPAYFTNAQRADTRLAGELAGLKVERIINEPSAAALAAQVEESADACDLVFDFGGGTLDVSLVERFENVIDVTAIGGSNVLGGIDFDTDIAKWCCMNWNLSFENLAPSLRNTLLEQARTAKEALTVHARAEISLRYNDCLLEYTLTPEILIQACSSVFARILDPIQKVIAQSDYELEEIEEVLLVGGSSKMPTVQMFLEHHLGLPIGTHGSPDTIVAKGAAIYGAILERVPEVKNMVLNDVCPFTLGIEVRGTTLSPVIGRNTALPAVRQQEFTTVNDLQKEVTLKIFQGESLETRNDLYLGSITMPVLPRPAGMERVQVWFAYDVDGLLQVEASTNSTKQRESLLIVDGHASLSEKEKREKLTKLESLKILPQDRAENLDLLAQMDAAFEQAKDDDREEIRKYKLWFEQILTQQDSRRIAKARRTILSLLSFLKRRQPNLQVDKDWFEQEEDNLDSDFFDPGKLN